LFTKHIVTPEINKITVKVFNKWRSDLQNTINKSLVTRILDI